MLSVKIKFYPLAWYLSSPTAIVLYNRMYSYICKVFSSNFQNFKKRKCDLHEVSFASPKKSQRLANNVILFVMQSQ